MIKLSAAYFLGALTVAVAVFAAAPRFALLTFVMGLTFAVGGLALALGSRSRLLAAARLLTALAGQGATPKTASVDGARRVTGPDGRPRFMYPTTPLSIDSGRPQQNQRAQLGTALTSALVNLGTRRKDARNAVSEALAASPDGSFDELFRAALPRRTA